MTKLYVILFLAGIAENVRAVAFPVIFILFTAFIVGCFMFAEGKDSVAKKTLVSVAISGFLFASLNIFLSKDAFLFMASVEASKLSQELKENEQIAKSLELLSLNLENLIDDKKSQRSK